MSNTLVIEPITRIEGHAKITIQLDEHGAVAGTQFHVTQVRGFEQIAAGRPFREMPALMARICGICPVAHLIAGSKACDEILAVRIPSTATKLRRILNLAQIIQSHALSFFYLSAPDLLLGMDADPAQRHVIGLANADPELARGGIRLRQFGQQVIERLAGERIHPAWVIPGGVTAPLTPELREEILGEIPEVKVLARNALDVFKRVLPNFTAEIESFANFPTMFMGLVGADGALEYYDGLLRLVDADGNVVQSAIPPEAYADYIAETLEPHTYLKSPYYKPLGYPEGIYRVGPLARLHIAESCGTPLADAELAVFRDIPADQRRSGFYYHYARLIEVLHGIEKMEILLEDPDILNKRVQASASPNNQEGVGIAEAPRGILIHHYQIDEHGLITAANLIIATGHNNPALEKGIAQVARRFVDGNQLTEGALNRVEAVVRAFDPCLSCSTHAIGQMPLDIRLVAGDGQLLDRVMR